jgi:UDP-GlcNAc3NAcA epimerase
MKIVTILGARPQFIKAAAVSKALADAGSIEEVIVHTGQHFDPSMSDIFFEELHLPAPACNLSVNRLSHGAMTGRMIEEIEKALLREKPDYVLLYGDTNSTLAGAIAAKKMRIKVIHVEAGLRCADAALPEEINRVVTDRLSDLLFCPTDTAFSNLMREGFADFDCRCYCVGDVMYDAVLHFLPEALAKSAVRRQTGYIACTLHRQELTDSEVRLRNVISALNTIHQTIPVVMPVHPRTKKMLQAYDIRPQFEIINPLGYLDMLAFVAGSRMTVTDSGGLQKESYFLKKCCAIVFPETPWVELVDHGYAALTGYDAERVVAVVHRLLDAKMTFSHRFYGDGNASALIAEKLLSQQSTENIQ